MEKKYYIVENESPQGPFSPDELRERGMTPQSRIFAKGWTGFRNASDVPELAGYIVAEPVAPEIPEETPAEPDSSAGVSDREILLRIMKNLDELQSENRRLRQEVDDLRQGNMPPPPPPRMPEVPAKENPPATPPPMPGEKAAQAKEEWDREWDKTLNTTQTSATKKSSNSGCMFAIIAAFILLILGVIIYAYSRSHNHYAAYADSDTITAEYEPVQAVEEMEVEAPTAEAATEAVAAEEYPTEAAEAYEYVPEDPEVNELLEYHDSYY